MEWNTLPTCIGIRLLPELGRIQEPVGVSLTTFVPFIKKGPKDAEKEDHAPHTRNHRAPPYSWTEPD